MKYKYLFFDLDGTLTDPAEGITNSIIYSLKKFNIEINDRTTLYKFIGPPLVDSFMKFYGFDEKRHGQQLNITGNIFGQRII